MLVRVERYKNIDRARMQREIDSREREREIDSSIHRFVGEIIE